jgi:hypothetical protein
MTFTRSARVAAALLVATAALVSIDAARVTTCGRFGDELQTALAAAPDMRSPTV